MSQVWREREGYLCEEREGGRAISVRKEREGGLSL